MAAQKSFLKARTRSTFFTSLLVISLVLFFLGITAVRALYEMERMEHQLENFEATIWLPEFIEEGRVKSVGEFLAKQPFIKGEIRFTSKAKAKEVFEKKYGKELVDTAIGLNFLPPSYHFKLLAEYVQEDSLEKVRAVMDQAPESIKNNIELDFPALEIKSARAEIQQSINLAIGIGILVAFLGFFIINSMVRMAIYSKRLSIRSMQLIGATSSFIRRPFLRLGILQGLLGGVIAITLLVLTLFFIGEFSSAYPEAISLLNRIEFMVLSGGIIIFGVILGWLSSLWAVNRFLHKNLNEII